jgi:hypothetical protein
MSWYRFCVYLSRIQMAQKRGEREIERVQRTKPWAVASSKQAKHASDLIRQTCGWMQICGSHMSCRIICREIQTYTRIKHGFIHELNTYMAGPHRPKLYLFSSVQSLCMDSRPHSCSSQKLLIYGQSYLLHDSFFLTKNKPVFEGFQSLVSHHCLTDIYGPLCLQHMG